MCAHSMKNNQIFHGDLGVPQKVTSNILDQNCQCQDNCSSKRNYKKSPVKFAVFSATVENFTVKFYLFIRYAYLHLKNEWHSVILTSAEVLDFFSAKPGYYCAIKNVCIVILLLFKQNSKKYQHNADDVNVA